MVGIRRFSVILSDPHTEFNTEKQTISTISVPNPSYSLEYPHIKSHLIQFAAKQITRYLSVSISNFKRHNIAYTREQIAWVEH